jgi:peptidoglycan/LPS O-acetylase OafA/YrhL
MKRQRRQKGDGVNVPAAKKRERILVFDILRILCIAAIVYDHIRFSLIPGFNAFLFADGYGPFSIYTNGLQGYAVYGMILVSGAVLEYNYQGLERVHDYLKFLFRRILRIYPAFWMSLIFCLVLYPVIFEIGLPTILMEFTGFYVALGQGPGYINEMGWFIAAIVSLYIFFPWLSKYTKRYGIWMLIAFALISLGMRSLVVTYQLIPLEIFWRWFPLFNAFEFCLGIWIVQNGFFPKNENTYPVVQVLSDVSFYVFLFHIPVFKIFRIYSESWLVPLDFSMAGGNAAMSEFFFYSQALVAILVVSWLAMKLDNRFQKWLVSREPVKQFLAS